MKKWARDLIESPARATIPIMTHPGIELCGRLVEEALKDGRVHFEAVKRLNDTWPAAASTLIMDLTVEAEAFGAKIVFSANEVPSVVGRLVGDLPSVEALEIPSLGACHVPEYLRANRLVAENITDKPLLGGCIGPFSLAGRLFDMSEIMMALYTEPETIRLLLDKCSRFIGDYIGAIKEAGADGVIIAEPAAGLVSGEDCSSFSSGYIGRMVEELQDDCFMIVLHNCGNTGHCTRAMIETGAGGLHFGNKIDMVQALEECPADVLVMGNIDPVGALKQGSPEDVKRQTLELLRRTVGLRNFVLSTGCDVPPNVPMENIESFYAALNEFNLNIS